MVNLTEIQLANNGDILFAGYLNDNYFLQAPPFLQGSDGSRTISTNTNEGVAIEKYYTDLTINSSVTWTLEDQSIIYVSGTLTINGAIVVNGQAGGAGGDASNSNGSDGGAGGTAGGCALFFANNVVCGTGCTITADGTDGTDGEDGAVANSSGQFAGNNGTAAADGTVYLTTVSTTGGNFGGGGIGAGGTAGAGTQSGGDFANYALHPPGYFRASTTLFATTYYPADKTAGGGGGGSGRYSLTNATSGYGGGGGSGGNIGSTSVGGAGGTGGTATSTSSAAGAGGGGGGGGGGHISLVYTSITDPGNLTISCDGGAGGDGGNSSSVNGAGGAGGGGSGGIIRIIGPSASSINVGVVAGAGGTGGTCSGSGGNGGNGSAGQTGTTIITDI